MGNIDTANEVLTKTNYFQRVKEQGNKIKTQTMIWVLNLKMLKGIYYEKETTFLQQRKSFFF